MSVLLKESTQESEVPGPTERLIYLLPEEITADETCNVRPFSTKMGDTEQEAASIQAMADSILEVGQEQPIRVRRLEAGGFGLIIGSRRRKAGVLINLGLSEGEPKFRLACVVSDDPVQDAMARRQAMIENLHRANLTPMDMAYNVQAIRIENKWQGTKGTKKVADYLKVSTATVTQGEKLLRLTPALQEKVQSGELKAGPAQDIAELPVDKQMPAFELASGLQKAERAEAGVDLDDAADDNEGQIGGPGAEDKDEQEPPKGGRKKKAAKKKKGGKGAGPRDTGTVQGTHVREAVRTLAPEQGKSRNRKALLDFWQGVADSPAYGYPDGAVRQFAEYYVGPYALGKGTDRTLREKFEAMTDGAPQGTAASEPKEEEQPKPKVVAKKKAAKKAAKKK